MPSDERFSHLAREVATQQAAPFLFLEQELPVEVQKRMEKREQDANDWTAARLFSQRRQIYEVVVRMLGAGFHVRLIADLCEVSEKTVRAVREAEGSSVTAFREKLGVRRRNMMAMCADNIAAALEAGGAKNATLAKDLAVVWNILDGQDRLDSGAPTQIIRVDEPPALEEYRRFIHALTIEGVVEVVPATGLAGGAPGQRPAPVAAPLPAGSDPDTTPATD